MKLIRVTCFLAIVAMFFSPQAGAKKDTLYLILPKLDTATIGFSLTDEEQTEYHRIIVKAVGKTFKSEVLPRNYDVDLSGLGDRPVVVFLIVDYYINYHSLGGMFAKLSTRVQFFKNVGIPKSEYFVVNLLGGGAYGRNTPFEHALKDNLEEIRKLVKWGKHPVDSTFSVSDVLGFKSAYPCSATILVPLPYITQQAMGYDITPEESHDFSHLLADSLSSLAHKNARSINQQEISLLSECYAYEADIGVSHENKTISLSIRDTKSQDFIFTDTYQVSNTLDWSDNVGFAQTIGKAFTAFREKYQKEKVHF